MAKTTRALCFVDGSGGAFAAIAAAIAGAAGRDATAAVTGGKPRLPAEVRTVLEEIGLSAPEVSASVPAGAERIDVDGWGTKLFEGEGELEHLASARIARDRIERRVSALLAR